VWGDEIPAISDYIQNIIDKIYLPIGGYIINPPPHPPPPIIKLDEIAPQQVNQMSVAPVYVNRSMSFGDVYINDTMDWEMFKANVHKALFEE
jgi:hypothetical protein